MKERSLLNKIYFLCFLVASAALIFDAYLQFSYSLSSCGLAYVERILLFAASLTFLGAALYHHTAMSNRLCGFLLITINGLGLGTALRHAYLQHFPSTLSLTLNPNNYTSQLTYFTQWLKLTYMGTADCSQAMWQWYGITLAEWTVIVFAGLLIASIWQLRHRH